MEVKHFKDINLISKVLYVISIIILVYTLLTIYNSHVYISSLVASNRIVVSESILMVITYYINSSLPYAFYSIATFSMGYIISGLNVKKEVKKENLKLVWALALPGKIAPITSAEFIKETIYNIIKNY